MGPRVSHSPQSQSGPSVVALIDIDIALIDVVIALIDFMRFLSSVLGGELQLLLWLLLLLLFILMIAVTV